MANLAELEYDGPIARLWIAREERHNSLVPELLEDLLAALAAAERRPETRVLILCARGASFSTGGDLDGFLAHWDEREAYGRRIVSLLNDVVLRIANARVPVIAAVDGWVTGGSLGLVLAADLVLVTARARFAPYYCEVGFSPDGGWGVLLPELIGARQAARLQYLNETLSAEEAVRLGLATELVAADALMPRAREWAETVAAMVPASVEATKRLLRRNTSHWADLLAAELESFVARLADPATRGPLEAFVDRMKS